MELITIGGLSLFISWLFFNAGSAKTVKESNAIDVAMATQCTVLAAAGAIITSLFAFTFIFNSHKDPTKLLQVPTLINTLMSGCVSITASCNNVDLFSALIIGCIGSLLYACFRLLY
jgi:ammonium transporter, Amt family